MTMFPPTRLSGWMSPNGDDPVVEEQHGGLLLLEELLEGEELAAVAQRVAGQEPQLGQAVEDDVPGLARSTSARICRVVSPSSISDGWKTDDSDSPARLSRDRGQVADLDAPRDQPCERQACSRSLRVSVRVM